ncbi:MAG: DMT family transporter [Verrucomicrobia bacterium]|nr:DMT family transporter [Verrucomicrobiota bacterium]
MDLFRRYDLKKGVLLSLIAWASFSAMYAIGKLLGDRTTVSTMIFFRNILGLVVVLPWIVKNRPESLKVKNFKLILIRSISGVLNLVFIFLAVQKISLVDATLLNNTAPLIVPFIALFWLKIPLEIKVWPAILLGFIGVALILQPTKLAANLGMLYGLLSGICLALSLITTRLSARQESFNTFLFYFFGIGLILTAPFAILNWKVDDLWTLALLLAIGLFSTLGQVGLFYGLRLGKARQLAPIAYSSVVFSGLLEWLIWDIVPAPIFYIGMVLVVASGIWIVFESRPPTSA